MQSSLRFSSAILYFTINIKSNSGCWRVGSTTTAMAPSLCRNQVEEVPLIRCYSFVCCCRSHAEPLDKKPDRDHSHGCPGGLAPDVLKESSVSTLERLLDVLILLFKNVCVKKFVSLVTAVRVRSVSSDEPDMKSCTCS